MKCRTDSSSRSTAATTGSSSAIATRSSPPFAASSYSLSAARIAHQQVERLATHGARRAMRRRETLMEPGDQHPSCFVVVRDSVEIERCAFESFCMAVDTIMVLREVL
jgi:uncharacterized protein (DUF2252 family)